jgi:hypothetical protein
MHSVFQSLCNGCHMEHVSVLCWLMACSVVPMKTKFFSFLMIRFLLSLSVFHAAANMLSEQEYPWVVSVACSFSESYYTLCNLSAAIGRHTKSRVCGCSEGVIICEPIVYVLQISLKSSVPSWMDSEQFSVNIFPTAAVWSSTTDGDVQKRRMRRFTLWSKPTFTRHASRHIT